MERIVKKKDRYTVEPTMSGSPMIVDNVADVAIVCLDCTEQYAQWICKAMELLSYTEAANALDQSVDVKRFLEET